MDEVARVTGEDRRAVEGFLAAVKTFSTRNKDPELYTLAVKALESKNSLLDTEPPFQERA
jgi:hypothetical protein